MPVEREKRKDLKAVDRRADAAAFSSYLFTRKHTKKRLALVQRWDRKSSLITLQIGMFQREIP